MSEDPHPPEDALAALMSIKDISERRDFIAQDVEGARRYSSIQRLTLALVLQAPFGTNRQWRRMRYIRQAKAITNEVAFREILLANLSWRLCDHFLGRMPKARYDELSRILESLDETGPDGHLFNFSQAELSEINRMLKAESLEEIGTEVFWSYDMITTSAGVDLPFIFSMLNRQQLLGCVAGPYDNLEDLNPYDHGLVDLDDL